MFVLDLWIQLSYSNGGRNDSSFQSKGCLDDTRDSTGSFAMAQICLDLNVTDELAHVINEEVKETKFTEPINRGVPSGRSLKACARASTSIGSPTGVPVPWHSTYAVSAIGMPAAA